MLTNYRLYNLNNKNKYINNLYLKQKQKENPNVLTLPDYLKHMENFNVKDIYLEHENTLKQPDSLTPNGEGGIIDMNRQTNNLGKFAVLSEKISKKNIRKIAKQSGIDLKGLVLNVDKNEELLELPLAGRADHENIGQITFFPNAFRNKEEMIRTLYHEKIHVEQYKRYGTEYVQNNRKYFEDEAYKAEDDFIKRLKERGDL